MEEKITLPESEENSDSFFTWSEMAHLAVNYAITSMKGYDGSFINWFNQLDPNWRDRVQYYPRKS